ncbi:MAG: hypothetical protein ACPIOQ_85765, partial [Promethearchaeia archaeon]
MEDEARDDDSVGSMESVDSRDSGDSRDSDAVAEGYELCCAGEALVAAACDVGTAARLEAMFAELQATAARRLANL